MFTARSMVDLAKKTLSQVHVLSLSDVLLQVRYQLRQSSAKAEMLSAFWAPLDLLPHILHIGTLARGRP